MAGTKGKDIDFSENILRYQGVYPSNWNLNMMDLVHDTRDIKQPARKKNKQPGGPKMIKGNDSISRVSSKANETNQKKNKKLADSS
jgi:hypothetical protein